MNPSDFGSIFLWTHICEFKCNMSSPWYIWFPSEFFLLYFLLIANINENSYT